MRHFSLFALSLIAAFAVSCNPMEEPKPKETQEIKVEESSKNALEQPSIAADATKAESVSFSVNGPWHADVSQATKAGVDWLQVSPASGQAGNYTLEISLSKNTDTAPRSAVIKLVCGTVSEEISITQSGAEPPVQTCGIVKRLKIAGDDEVEEISYQYDSEGRVSVLTIGHRYGDDFDSMTLNVKYQDGSATISFGDYSIIYSLDAPGRPVKVDDGVDLTEFGYDEQGHLTKVGGTYTSDGEVPGYLLYAGGALVGATTNKSAIASETQRCSKYLDVVYPNKYSVQSSNIDLNMAMLYGGWVSPFGIEFAGMHYAGDYLMECPFALALEVMLDGSDEDDISEVLTPGKWTFNDKSWPVSFLWQNGSMKYSVEVEYYQ